MASILRTLRTAAPVAVVETTPVPSVNLAAQFEQRLYESFAQILPAWALKAVQDPFAYGINTGGAFGSATGTTNDRRGGKDVPLFWNELDLRGYRILSRQICDSNQFGIGFTKLLSAYHIHKGYGWQACLKGQKKSPYATSGAGADPLVTKAQSILDQWRDVNQWGIKSDEAFRRWCRDGETFGRFFQQGAGQLSTFRFPEPEQIGSPTGNVDDDESFGIATDPGDPYCPRAYHIWEMSAGLMGEWVDASRIIHAKKNVDSGIKRGLPDFFPVAEDLDGVRRLLHTMLATSIKQARTAWIEKLQNASAAIAASTVPENANTGTNQLQPSIDGAIGRAIADQFGRFGINGQSLSDVRRVEGSRQYEAGPTTSPEGFIAALQAVLRGCGVIWNFPEYFSGDASNNNMASSIVAGSPFVRTVEGSQYKWGVIWERPCALKALELARDAGLLSWDEWSRLDVEVTEPAVATADPLKDTQVYTQQLQAKIVSLDTVRQKLGYDPQHEAEGVQKDADTAQPQPGPVAQADPNAPPPELLGEAIREEHQAQPPFPGAVFDTTAHRWKNPHTGEFHDPKHAADHLAQPEPVESPNAKLAAKVVALSTDLSPEQQETYTRHFAAVLDQMPAAARNAALQALQNGVVRFHPDMASLKAASEAATRQKVTGELAGFVLYDPKSFLKTELHLDGALVGLEPQSIYAHELGHLVDLYVGQKIGSRLIDDPKWQSAWKAEISNSRPATRKGLSKYAATNAKEGFAELYRVIHEQGIDTIRERFPKCVAFLEKKGLLK